MQPRAESGVIAIGAVGKQRRRRQLPSRRPLDQRRGELRLRLEDDAGGDLRPPTPLVVDAPLLRQIEREAERQRPPLADRVQADRDLAVADLAQSARVLALHPRRVRAVLRDAGVVDDPGQHAKLGRHPLGAATDQKLRLPGRVGQKLLHRLVASRRLAQPKQRRLQALATAVLDQPAHIHERVLPLTHMRQRPHHPLDKREQPLARLARRHLHHRSFHPSPPRTMTANADTVRRPETGPFNELTKHY